MDLYQRSMFSILNDGLKGWFDGVGVRTKRTPRPAAHGEFDLPVFREARIITLHGGINTASEFAQEQAINRLLGICADGSTERFTVESAAGPTWADVKLGDDPDIQVLSLGQTARLRLTFRAADPRRYGRLNTFPEGPVFHRGNFPASPTLKVSGSRPEGWTVTGPGGRRIVVTRALEAGRPHTIDLATGGLYVNGARVLGGVITYEPWVVPAGRSVTHSVTSGLSLESGVPDTYM